LRLKICCLFFVSLLLGFGCNKPEQELSKIPSDAITKLYVSGASDFYDARPRGVILPKPDVYSCVGYKLKMKYPAKSVISFYQEKLKDLGFEPYKDSKLTGGKYEWQSFADGVFKKTALYLSIWRGLDKKR
jgi:hypothetical protein